MASTEVLERDIVEMPDVLTTTIATITSSTTTPLVTQDVEPRGTSSPRVSLPQRISNPIPLLLLHVDPRTWMQQLTEGQTTEPRREDASLSESNTSIVETLPGDIPDELSHEWRVLHLFELP